MDRPLPETVRRLIVLAFFAVGLGTYVVCAIEHTCVCGHAFHLHRSWTAIANDMAWFTCLGSAAVLAVKANLVGSWPFAIEIGAMLLLRTIFGGVLPVFELAVVLCSMLNVAICFGASRGPRYQWPACRECGYNLTGNVSGVCPECGLHI